MTETMHMQLEAAPGRLKAVWVPAQGTAAGGKERGQTPAEPEGYTQVLKMDVWPAGKRREVVERLADRPLEWYGLLKGRLPEWLAGLGLWPGEAELAGHGQADSGTAGSAESLSAVIDRLAKEPLTALALRGLPKEELADAVFAIWAKDEDAVPAEETGPADLAAELARLEKKGAAVSAGEWLAEAAEEGSLHQPGPLFLEVRDRKVPAEPARSPETGNWQKLLPGVPRAAEGLELIKRRAAENAARRARGLGK